MGRLCGVPDGHYLTSDTRGACAGAYAILRASDGFLLPPGMSQAWAGKRARRLRLPSDTSSTGGCAAQYPLGEDTQAHTPRPNLVRRSDFILAWQGAATCATNRRSAPKQR